MKRCRICGETKALTEFHRNRTTPDGRESQCQPCAHHYRTMGYTRGRRLRKRFGITPEQYDWMLQAQGGICAICGQEETAPYIKDGRSRHLAVDHDHKTRVLRGLLCRSCNTGLGSFGDDIPRLRSAIRYLETARKR
jgi:hypothetical protein